MRNVRNVVNRPTLPYSINWGHPLAQGLVFCCIIDESKRLIDLVTNTVIPFVGSGAIAETNYGYVLDCSAAVDSGGLVTATGPVVNVPSTQGSMVIRCAFAGTPTGGAAPITAVDNYSGSTFSSNGWGLYSSQNSPSTGYTWIVGSNLNLALTSIVGINTTPRDVVMTSANSGSSPGYTDIFENGVLLIHNPHTVANDVTPSVAKIEMGPLNGFGRNNQALIHHSYIYDRPLNNTQAVMAYTEPYSILVPARRYSYGVGFPGPPPVNLGGLASW